MGGSDLNILKIILSSGPVVQLVLLSLVVASIYCWAIVIKKIKTFKKIRFNNSKFLEIYKDAESLKVIKDRSETLGFSPFREIFIEGHSELIKLKAKYSDERGVRSHLETHGMAILERALQKGINNSNLQLDKYLSPLASIGSVSPFVGLFGTVWGIVNSFSAIAGGGGTLEAVAPGIAEALIATAVGLAAAIPAVLFYNHFSNVNAALNTEMATFGQDFLNVVERSTIKKES